MRYKGLNTDIRREQRPEGYGEYTRNMMIDELGTVMNEPGFIKRISNTIGELVGFINTLEGIVLFFVTQDGNEIGFYTSQDGYKVVLRGDLGFSSDYPITGVFKKNNKDETVITFTDDYNPPRLLNIDNLPFDVNSNMEVTGDNIELLNMFQEFTFPDISVSSNDAGGTLSVGTYFFAVSYKFADGGYSNISYVTNGIQVTSDPAPGKLNGGRRGETTSKSITINIDNADVRYTELALYVIKVVDGQTISERLDKNIPITKFGTAAYTYTGNEIATTQTLSELLVDSAVFTKVGTMESFDNRLYIADLEIDEPLNLQPYVNNIKVNYTIESFSPASQNQSFYDSGFTYRRKGFAFGETYALYVAFKLKKGGLWTKAYHIPGRAPRSIYYHYDNGSGEQTLSSERSDVGLLKLSGSFPNASLLNDDDQIADDVKYFHFRDTADNPSAESNMGFWENASEQYPNTSDYDGSIAGENIAGENVRHHKFPSMNYIKKKFGDPETFAETHYSLGINISDLNLPSEIEEQIDGYKIFYAKRTISNATVLGQSAGNVLFKNSPYRDADKLYSMGYNIDYTSDEGIATKEYMRLNPPDLLLNKPSVSPILLTQEYVLKTSDYTTTLADFNIVTDIDYRESIADEVSHANYIIKANIADYLYYPTNIIGDVVDNIGSEESMVFKIANPSKLTFNVPSVGNSIGIEEQSPVFSIRQHLPNVYLGYNNQPTLLATNRYYRISDNGGVTYGGDTVISDYVHFASGAITEEHYTRMLAGNAEKGGQKVRKYYYIQTANNFNFRDTNESIQSKILDDLADYDVLLPLEIEYNTDFSSLNEFNTTFTEEATQNFISSYPFQIARSASQGVEDNEDTWREFPVNDYYNVTRDRGKIVKLIAFGNKLLIHHKKGLFITMGKETFIAENNNYDIGSGDIFRAKPTEIIPTDGGYFGLISYYSSIVCRFGYIFIDDRGNIIQFNDDLSSLSNMGISNYVRDTHKKGDNPFKNPLDVNLISYDEKYKRLLVSIDNDTISYSFNTKAWISFHDYRPSVYMNINDELFSWKTDNLFQHNKGDKGLYYNESPYNAYLDLIIRRDSNHMFTVVTTDYNVEESFEKTASKIIIYNSFQCSGAVDFTATRIREQFRFNKFMDIAISRPFFSEDGQFIEESVDVSKPWHKQGRFKGKFIMVRLIIDNEYNENHYIHDVNVESRPIGR